MLRPPKTGVSRKISDIRGLLVETWRETELLFQQRIMEMRVDNLRMKKQLESVYQLQHCKQQRDNYTALSQLRKELKISDDDSHTGVTKYKQLFDRAFSDSIDQIEGLHIMTWERFLMEPTASAWLKATSSRVLVVSGQNNEQVGHTNFSWLSEAAIHVAHGSAPGSRCSALGFFFCRPQPAILSAHRPRFKDVLTTWLYQLLGSLEDPTVAVLESIKKAFTGDLWDTNMADALAKVIDTFTQLLAQLAQDAVVNLVLDRADQCCLYEAQEYTQADYNAIVDWLVKLAQRSPRILKILVISHPTVTCSRTKWKRRERAAEMGAYSERLDWNQGDAE